MRVANSIWRDPHGRAHQFFWVEVKPESWHSMENPTANGVRIADAKAAVDDYYSHPGFIPMTADTSFLKLCCESFAIFEFEDVN